MEPTARGSWRSIARERNRTSRRSPFICATARRSPKMFRPMRFRALKSRSRVGGSDADGDALSFKRVGGPRDGNRRTEARRRWRLEDVLSQAARFGAASETIRYVAARRAGQTFGTRDHHYHRRAQQREQRAEQRARRGERFGGQFVESKSSQAVAPHFVNRARKKRRPALSSGDFCCFVMSA